MFFVSTYVTNHLNPGKSWEPFVKFNSTKLGLIDSAGQQANQKRLPEFDPFNFPGL